ncbi:MAG: hypothetical protein GX217_04415 [Clostridiaceae bacterium]|jgi:hypothetical protein|nr:hypothetical protein [Clostridiaceae bacterium]
MGVIGYYLRTQKLVKKPYIPVGFSQSEVVLTMVNLLDARRTLSVEDYYYVKKLFDEFESREEIIMLNQQEFLKLGDEIRAHFDLVAPYYKFCGNKGFSQALQAIDKYKNPYRAIAKKILAKDDFFSEAWMVLHGSFIKQFDFDE